LPPFISRAEIINFPLNYSKAGGDLIAATIYSCGLNFYQVLKHADEMIDAHNERKQGELHFYWIFLQLLDSRFLSSF